MFDHKHYVPIFRWKRGEYIALRELFSQEKAAITPMAEIPPDLVSGARNTTPKSIGAILQKTAVQVSETWGSNYLFFDLGLLGKNLRAADDRHPVAALFDAARTLGLRFIPVTGLDRDAAYHKSVSEVISADRRGACIRLLDRDLASPALNNQLAGLLHYLKLTPKETHIVLDFGVLQNASLAYLAGVKRLPNLASWRTVTIAAGSLPVDLSKLSVGEHLLPRLEWQYWNKLVTENANVSRLPSFGDYTTQHPYYLRHLLPRGFINYSASIRYTTAENWIIMRGQGVFTEDSPGFAQFPANAILLRDRPEFCGRHYSYGDNYIYQKAIELEQNGYVKKPGSAETWLRAGVNHHITFVARQIASLFGSSTAVTH